MENQDIIKEFEKEFKGFFEAVDTEDFYAKAQVLCFLQKAISQTQKEAYKKGRLETIKEIEEKLPEKIITVFTIPMQTWRKGGFNDCLKEVQSILNQLKDNE